MAKKKSVIFVCLIIVLYFTNHKISAQTVVFPEEFRKILDRNYSGWQFDLNFRKKNKKFGFLSMPFLSGDWNSDGETDFGVFIKHSGKEKVVIFLRYEGGFSFYHIPTENFSPFYKIPRDRKLYMANRSKIFINNLPKDFQVPTDALGRKLLREYGAVFIARNGAVPPKFVVFKDDEQVSKFQSGVEVSKENIGGLDIELQTAAMKALKSAISEANAMNLTITPKESDAARRSYNDTIGLWRSRVEPGLVFWTEKGRISVSDAERIRALSPSEQIPEIFKLEEQGIYFAKDLSKTIIYSVAPPGTSQHLSMLALDVNEHENPFVREILAKHGWFQTVISDLPHFTFLGVSEAELPKLGLKKVESGTRHFWVPEM